MFPLEVKAGPSQIFFQETVINSTRFSNFKTNLEFSGHFAIIIFLPTVLASLFSSINQNYFSFY